MKHRVRSTIILIVAFFVGLSLLLYPPLADYWNSLTQSKAVSDYAEQVGNMNKELYEKMLSEAHLYNQELLERENQFRFTEEEREIYNAVLNLTSNGVMGYIEIPSIGCSLPIYHGVSESVLQVAIGHLEWSSLPVGGENTHSVVSGHRGLPSAKLFTDLDKLRAGDYFLIRVLDELLTYEVDQILIVNPDEVDALAIEAGEDYVTLVTCTPYGINSHRLLVRGHRVENIDEIKTIRVTADAIQIKPVLMAPLVASPMLLGLMLWLMLGKPKKH